MSVAPSVGAGPATGERLVWTGRYPDSWPDGLDSWQVSRQALAALLDELPLLVVLDPPSFPWPMYTSTRRAMPVVACLPDALDAETIGALLGGPLLSRVTPYDRLVEQRPDVRRTLEREWGLTPEVWLPADPGSGHPGGPDDAPGDDGEGGWRAALTDHLAALETDPDWLVRTRQAKARFNQLTLELSEGLRDGLLVTDPESDSETELPDEEEERIPPLVAMGGRTTHRWRALAVSAGVRVRILEDLRVDDPDDPTPEAVALVLEDGGQSSEERVALLRLAHQWLQPGGALVVLANVVTVPGGAPNPSLTTLVEEIHEATGTAVHLQDLRSVRWLEEPMSRGVLLRLTSLRERSE